MARYSRVGRNVRDSRITRYSLDNQGNVVSTEIEPPEETPKLCFKDTQRLELVRNTLSVSVAIIESCLDTAVGCLEFCNHVERAPLVRNASCSKLKLFIEIMRVHGRAAGLLVKQSEKTAHIVRHSSFGLSFTKRYDAVITNT